MGARRLTVLVLGVAMTCSSCAAIRDLSHGQNVLGGTRSQIATIAFAARMRSQVAKASPDESNIGIDVLLGLRVLISAIDLPLSLAVDLVALLPVTVPCTIVDACQARQRDDNLFSQLALQSVADPDHPPDDEALERHTTAYLQGLIDRIRRYQQRDRFTAARLGVEGATTDGLSRVEVLVNHALDFNTTAALESGGELQIEVPADLVRRLFLDTVQVTFDTDEVGAVNALAEALAKRREFYASPPDPMTFLDLGDTADFDKSFESMWTIFDQALAIEMSDSLRARFDTEFGRACAFVLGHELAHHWFSGENDASEEVNADRYGVLVSTSPDELDKLAELHAIGALIHMEEILRTSIDPSRSTSERLAAQAELRSIGPESMPVVAADDNDWRRLAATIYDARRVDDRALDLLSLARDERDGIAIFEQVFRDAKYWKGDARHPSGPERVEECRRFRSSYVGSLASIAFWPEIFDGAGRDLILFAANSPDEYLQLSPRRLIVEAIGELPE